MEQPLISNKVTQLLTTELKQFLHSKARNVSRKGISSRLRRLIPANVHAASQTAENPDPIHSPDDHDRYLARMMVFAQFRKEVEATQSEECLRKLEQLGLSVRYLRRAANENRDSLASAIGIEEYELVAIENAYYPLAELALAVPRIEDHFGATIEKEAGYSLTEQLQDLNDCLSSNHPQKRP